MSVNFDRQRSLDVSVITEKLLEPVRVHARVPVIFSIQETTSWDVLNLNLRGNVCCGSKFGFATLTVSDQFCNIKRSWRLEERCIAVLFEATLAMAVYAPDSSKDMELYEAFISSVFEVLSAGRRGGVGEFYISGDVNVELDELYGKGMTVIQAVSRR